MSMFSALRTEHVGKRERQLLTEFTFSDKLLGLIKVPAGFITDFASIGLLRYIAPLLFALLSGYGDHAAVIHDYLYSAESKEVYPGLSRKQADEVFYRALRAEGIARWRASIFYYGVRLFGWGAFEKGTREMNRA